MDTLGLSKWTPCDVFCSTHRNEDRWICFSLSARVAWEPFFEAHAAHFIMLVDFAGFFLFQARKPGNGFRWDSMSGEPGWDHSGFQNPPDIRGGLSLGSTFCCITVVEFPTLLRRVGSAVSAQRVAVLEHLVSTLWVSMSSWLKGTVVLGSTLRAHPNFPVKPRPTQCCHVLLVKQVVYALSKVFKHRLLVANFFLICFVG